MKNDTSVLDAYDHECRREVQSPEHVCAWDGPVFRMTGKSPHAYDNAVLFARLDDTNVEAAKSTGRPPRLLARRSPRGGRGVIP